MAQVAPATSQFQLKKDSLSKESYDIDLKIQQFKQTGNLKHIPNLEAAKLELHKQIVKKEVELRTGVASS